MTGDDLGMFERLVRIEAKLDMHADHEVRIRKLESDVDPKTHDDHETRLRRIEKALWIAVGAAGAAGGVLGQVASQLMGG
jgi:hypothetical protein